MGQYVASYLGPRQAHQTLVPIALEAEIPKTDVILQLEACLHLQTCQMINSGQVGYSECKADKIKIVRFTLKTRYNTNDISMGYSLVT